MSGALVKSEREDHSWATLPERTPEYEAELKREKLARHIHELYEAAPNSLRAHTQLFHRTPEDSRIVPARHHQEWVDVLEDRETYPWVCVVAPPGYAKSTWFSMAYPAWRIGQTGGRVRIGLIANTATQAQGFAQAIRDVVDTPEYRRAYPDALPDYERGWRISEWAMTNCPQGQTLSLTAAGYQGPILGKRFDEIILDDPTTWDEARSVATMEKQRHWLRSTLITRFPPGKRPPHGHGGRMVVVLTRWSEQDLVPTLEELGFKIIRMPALGYWDRVVDEETGELLYGMEPLWPETEPLEQLEAERDEDELIFELVKQGNPRVLAGDTFNADNFQRGEPPAQFDRVVQYVDTAGGRDRKKGDWFALLTMGRKGRDIWVVDVVRKRMGAPDQQAAVKAAAEKWSPDMIFIEAKNEGVALYQQLVQEARLPLQLQDVTKDKEFRAIPLSNAYRARMVWHDEGAKWRRSFEAELEAFPAGAHDDQVDAAAGAFNALDEDGPRVRVL